MGAYEALAASYDRLTNDVDYGATVAFYREILAREGLRPRTAVDLAIDDIILWYGTRYQVNLGDSTNLEHKIACMNAVIAQLSEYQSGVLDCSFTIWPNQVGYTPFS